MTENRNGRYSHRQHRTDPADNECSQARNPDRQLRGIIPIFPLIPFVAAENEFLLRDQGHPHEGPVAHEGQEIRENAVEFIAASACAYCVHKRRKDGPHDPRQREAPRA